MTPIVELKMSATEQRSLVGLPAYLVRRLQSVQNAATRLVFRLRRSDHITDALVSLQSTGCECPKGLLSRSPFWPIGRCPSKCPSIHGDAPQYLRQLTSIADIPSRQRLRPSTSDELCAPVVRLPTIGHRAFPLTGSRLWNDLPADVTSAPSLLIFRKRLELHLFRLSYPDLVLWINCFTCVVLVVAACYLGHLKKILDWLIDWLNGDSWWVTSSASS